jgi:hypothetical protein
MIHAASNRVATCGNLQSVPFRRVQTDLTSYVHRNGQGFHIPDKLWVRMIYEAATAFRYRAIDRDHLLQSLVLLYLGRTASFVLEVTDTTRPRWGSESNNWDRCSRPKSPTSRNAGTPSGRRISMRSLFDWMLIDPFNRIADQSAMSYPS